MDSLRDLQEKWDRASRWYDLATVALEALVFRRLRSRLLKSAVGRVLEVAAGSGLNLAHYSGDLDITAIDLSPGMLIRARSRGAQKVAVMDAQHLAFKDGSFDTVVSTLGTCTFPDPVEALREIRRVCRPGGTVLLLEHGRSDRPGLAAWQDRRAPTWAVHLGCWWNREPLDNVRRAGLQPHAATRECLGMVHIIRASV
ncbi:MAG: methyltransferase domain-containing protein [Candidatus Solibacter sp.]|nr:methyltransferase domain-containing protein [Candidatus Solibacter sp.]